LDYSNFVSFHQTVDTSWNVWDFDESGMTRWPTNNEDSHQAHTEKPAQMTKHNAVITPSGFEQGEPAMNSKGKGEKNSA